MTETEKEALYAAFKLCSIREIEPSLIQTFQCELNQDLTSFIHNTAIDYEKKANEKVIDFYMRHGFRLLDTYMEEPKNDSIRMIYKI